METEEELNYRGKDGRYRVIGAGTAGHLDNFGCLCNINNDKRYPQLPCMYLCM